MLKHSKVEETIKTNMYVVNLRACVCFKCCLSDPLTALKHLSSHTFLTDWEALTNLKFPNLIIWRHIATTQRLARCAEAVFPTHTLYFGRLPRCVHNHQSTFGPFQHFLFQYFYAWEEWSHLQSLSSGQSLFALSLPCCPSCSAHRQRQGCSRVYVPPVCGATYPPWRSPADVVVL